MKQNKKAMSKATMIIVGVILGMMILLIFTEALGKIPELWREGSELTCEKTYKGVCVEEDEPCPDDTSDILITDGGCEDYYKCCASTNPELGWWEPKLNQQQ